MSVEIPGSRSAGPETARRRKLGRVYAELHYRLRMEGGSPRERALAIGLGVAIGCLPLYGLHLLLCIVFAKLFGVSRITTYLAAHVNNQFTAPFLLFAEYALGHRLLHSRWPEIGWDALRSASLLDLGRDLLLGSVVIGVGLGAVSALVSLVIDSRWRRAPFDVQLLEAVSARYMVTDVFSWEFVRGKLRHDPLYFGVLRAGVLPGEGSLVDLGCGRGIFLAQLATAASMSREGKWSEEWPKPSELTLCGIEGRPKHADVARQAVPEARIEAADLTTQVVPEGDVMLLFDVLHYLDESQQTDLVERVAEALRPGGLLLVREADRDKGSRFVMTRIQERCSSLARGAWRQKFHYRGTADWIALFERQGLSAESAPMAEGTPFANDLIVARKAAR